jgi:hypothetical protein
VIIAALVMLVVLGDRPSALAVVDAISVTGVSADCKQVTITLTDSGGTGTRTGYIEFVGSVAIPQINVSCALGNCDSTNDVYNLALNGGAGYSSADSIPFRHQTIAAAYLICAGFPCTITLPTLASARHDGVGLLRVVGGSPDASLARTHDLYRATSR